MDGEAEIYATFAEESPEYTVTVTENENATASLINVDENGGAVNTASLFTLMSAEDGITAAEGEEIYVNAAANSNYTIDAVYVNGEAITGDSFIIERNSTVTLEVFSISTGIEAQTYDAQNVTFGSAVVGGNVSTVGASRYIRYWKQNDQNNVYTTDVMSGEGEYSVELWPLEPETTYYYQMTESGEIKSFTTLAEEILEAVEAPVSEASIPITETTYKTLSSTYKFTILCDEELENAILAVGLFDNANRLLDIRAAEADGDDTYILSTPKNTNASYAKIFVWQSFASLLPLGGVETVQIE